ncbi:MAG: sigma-70 family polymerase sigma factor [Chitinophagaceae bacterium]|nr:sigma-70 family polymerase sigma factor [Chitinophagaceae bacterium]MDB5223712.1 sigma-70 family polymerase sigma factor [Chitinophagaceae bacterium]
MKEALSIPALMNEKKNISHIVAEFSNRLFGFIKNRVATTEDAEDILQDVFYQLAGNTSPIEQLSAWLFTTARNKITDNYRKKKTELLDDIFSSSGEEDIEWEEILFTAKGDAETEYLRNIFWTTLNEALDELPAEQKEVFIAHELDDIPFEKISKQMNVPVATLISRKRYAVLHLRERLETLKNELLNF